MSNATEIFNTKLNKTNQDAEENFASSLSEVGAKVDQLESEFSKAKETNMEINQTAFHETLRGDSEKMEAIEVLQSNGVKFEETLKVFNATLFRMEEQILELKLKNRERAEKFEKGCVHA